MDGDILPWARILKNLIEAEKSTFRGELSFQRSECTAGFTVATQFLWYFLKTFFFNSLEKQINLLNDATFAFYIKIFFILIWQPWTYTFSPAVTWKSLRIRALVSIQYIISLCPYPSINTSFDPPYFSLDTTFKQVFKILFYLPKVLSPWTLVHRFIGVGLSVSPQRLLHGP